MEAYADVLDLLVEIWLLDDELGVAVAEQPWVIGQKQVDDGYRSRSGDIWLLQEILGMASTNTELARLVTSVPWFLDGTTYAESIAIRSLADIASKDIGLASLVAGFSWFADGSFDAYELFSELLKLDNSGLISTDVELARDLTGVWLAHGPPPGGTGYFIDLASTDIELARQVATLPWLTDGITSDEAGAVLSIGNLARLDIEWTRELIKQSWPTDEGTLAWRVLTSLAVIAGKDETALGKLTGQSWFADGLSDAEAALVATLSSVVGKIQTGFRSNREIPELYDDLLEVHHIQHKTVSMPLAGEVNLWVVESAAPPADEDLLSIIEETARIAEGFLGIPFPTTDVILLVLPGGHGIRGAYFRTHFVLARKPGRNPVEVQNIPHETAHYYFQRGPRWFKEGGAELIEAYYNDQMDIEDLADRRIGVSQKAQLLCYEWNGVENIRHSEYLGGGGESCPYVMGETFLFNTLDVVGKKAIATSLGELLLNRAKITEDDIYHTFLKHAPGDKKEAFIDLYRKLHGGSAAFPEPDFSDDHGDELATASKIELGETVNGTLDYMFDFDYFQFQAEHGQRYRIGVDHETLRFSSAELYDDRGIRSVEWRSIWEEKDRAPYGLRVRWVAPDSGEYYFAVQNFGGKSGPYSFSITPVEAFQDDHDDTAATATDISVGETVESAIDYEFDFDFFRFQTVADQEYELTIDSVTLPYARVRMYESDGVTAMRYVASATTAKYAPAHKDSVPGGGNSTSEWTAPNSGVYYLAVDGAFDSVGTYRLLVSELEAG